MAARSGRGRLKAAREQVDRSSRVSGRVVDKPFDAGVMCCCTLGQRTDQCRLGRPRDRGAHARRRARPSQPNRTLNTRSFISQACRGYG